MRISDWSSDVCSSDLNLQPATVIAQIERDHRLGERGAQLEIVGDVILQVHRRQPVPITVGTERVADVEVGIAISARIAGLVLTYLRSEERRGRERVCQYV